MAGNTYAISGSLVYITLTNTEPHIIATASLDDLDTLKAHRWRWINHQVVTTEKAGETELPIKAANLLTHQPREVTIYQKSPTDLRRGTFAVCATRGANDFKVQGATTYFLIPNGKTIYVDTEDVPRIQSYHWDCQIIRGTVLVTAIYYKGKNKRCIRLNRFLLNMKARDNRTITHRNNDVLDCRKANLEVSP